MRLKRTMQRYKIKLTTVAKEINKPFSTAQLLRDDNDEGIKDIIKKRAETLINIDLSQSDFSDTCKKLGLNKSYLASRAKMSRQLLNLQEKRGLPDHTKAKMQNIMQQIGRRIINNSK
jgi:hypothetical protein